MNHWLFNKTRHWQYNPYGSRRHWFAWSSEPKNERLCCFSPGGTVCGIGCVCPCHPTDTTLEKLTDTPPHSTDTELREQLAAIEHERWVDWQKYYLSKMHPVTHGHLLSHDQYQAWKRQTNTPYAELSKAEKATDMEQVDRYWPLIQKYIAQAVRAELDYLEQNGHDGGNWRRLIIERKAALEEEK